jgi:hypothetical protein
MDWNKCRRPPADICPERYCWHWVPPGGIKDVSGRVYDSVEEAFTQRDGCVEFPDGGCGCSVGFCTRLDPIAGKHDWYESYEPELERDGLPWFYFIATVDNLVEERHEQYLRESQELWGDHPDPA